MAGPKELDKAADRTDAAKEAGDTYTENLEDIRDNLDDQAGNGTQLGTMVKSQLELTEAEAKYNVKQGIPNKATKAVKAAADGVKQAAG